MSYCWEWANRIGVEAGDICCIRDELDEEELVCSWLVCTLLSCNRDEDDEDDDMEEDGDVDVGFVPLGGDLLLNSSSFAFGMPRKILL